MKKVKNSEANNNRLMIIIGMVAVAVVLVAGFIFFLNPNTNSISIDYSKIEQNRTEDGAYILGNPDTSVTIVAWEDFLCSHCQSYQPELKRFFEDFVATGRARFEFRMLPISQTSPLVFGLVECAEILEEGSFWDAHDTMFSITSAGFSDRSGRDFAEKMGMNYGDLLSCANESNQYLADQALANTFVDSSGQRMITGTPSVGWRLDGGEVRFDIISRRPSYQELSSLVNAFSSQ